MYGTCMTDEGTAPVEEVSLSQKLTKAELEETLRAHKLACDEMNSEYRERYVDLAMSKAMEGDDETLKGF